MACVRPPAKLETYHLHVHLYRERSVVHEIMHPDVRRSSGHVGNFNDPLVDCLVCQERFRADKAPKPAAGSTAPITLGDKGRAKLAEEKIKALVDAGQATLTEGAHAHVHGTTVHGLIAGDRGYVCPNCGSPVLSAERSFNGMFETNYLGPVDPMQSVIEALRKGVERGRHGRRRCDVWPTKR